MGWIAAKKMAIMRAGKKIQVKPGDPVPEADNWPNRDAWEKERFIRQGYYPPEDAPTTPENEPVAIAVSQPTPISPDEEIVSDGTELKRRPRGRPRKNKTE